MDVISFPFCWISSYCSPHLVFVVTVFPSSPLLLWCVKNLVQLFLPSTFFPSVCACMGASLQACVSTWKAILLLRQTNRAWSKVLHSFSANLAASFLFLYRPFELIASGSLVVLLLLEWHSDLCVCVYVCVSVCVSVYERSRVTAGPSRCLLNCLMAVMAVAHTHNQSCHFSQEYVCMSGILIHCTCLS